MVHKIVEPVVFGFLFVVLFWLSERNKPRTQGGPQEIAVLGGLLGLDGLRRIRERLA
jgi:hypothetical protein